jgi:serine/threonine protein kinase
MKDNVKNFIGAVLNNKYEVKALLGKGGTGNVFKAQHLHMEMPVAIKILHPDLSADETMVKRFHREARLAISIKHPNAVSVMDFGVIEGNTFYLVMELITGVSLSMLLKRESKLEIPRAVKLIQQICMGVGAAHQLGISHRDLKPGNVIIVDCDQPKELAKVIDFSIAKSDKSENLTGRDEVIGTPEYVSPEQVEGSSVDQRTDIYSMGIMLYQLLTGELPFQAKTPAALFIKHIHAKPQPPREINPAIPVELENVVLRALAKNPDDRPQTAAIFAEELEAFIANFDFVPTNNEAIPVADRSIQNDNPHEENIPTRIVSVDKKELLEQPAASAAPPAQQIEKAAPKPAPAAQPQPAPAVHKQSQPASSHAHEKEFDTPESMPAVKPPPAVAPTPAAKPPAAAPTPAVKTPAAAPTPPPQVVKSIPVEEKKSVEKSVPPASDEKARPPVAAPSVEKPASLWQWLMKFFGLKSKND